MMMLLFSLLLTTTVQQEPKNKPNLPEPSPQKATLKVEQTPSPEATPKQPQKETPVFQVEANRPIKCGVPDPRRKKRAKRATMETDEMRRAKRNHRGLPIDGCAPVPLHEIKERFAE